MKLRDLTTNKDIYVGLLTELQKDELVGQLYDLDSYFNPIQDIEDNWLISIEEMQQNENPNFTWVRDLPLIEYIPKPTPPPFEN
jgi:hypothetical protein